MPAFSWVCILFVVGFIVRWRIAGTGLAQKLMIFPHFKSPLNDLRELREMLYMYETTGSFFSGPYQVGQSELLLHVIYQCYHMANKSEMCLKVLLACFEMGKIAVQLLIFWKAYEGTSKKAADTDFALYFIMFNPISLLGGFQNLQGFADTLWQLLILAPLTDSVLSDRLILQVFAAIVCYFNPGSAICLLPLLVLQARLKVPESIGSNDTIRRVLLFAGFLNLIVMFCCSPSQMKNIVNILMVNNKAETMSNFWYIMVEMFVDRLVFFKKLYLLQQVLVCCFLSMLFHQTANYIDLLDENKVQTQQKSERRRLRLYFTGVLCISFVKLIMGAYPTLHEVNDIFFYLLMSLTFIRNYVEAFYLFIAGILFAVANSGFLWSTWLMRFSGNANFFYFQVIVLMSFSVLLFLQVYHGIDAKRKKYSKALVEAKKEAHAKLD